LEDEPIRSSEFLSQELMAYIGSLDRPDEPPAVSEEDREKIQRMFQVAISSLEGFAEPYAKRLLELLQEHRDTWEWFADDFYSREVVGNVQVMRTRFLNLCPVLVGVIPSREVAVYLREATRCYIYGFFQATIALCRAALEAGLNEHLERRLGRVPAQDLVDKIDAAQRLQLISGQGAHLAHEVRKTARNVLHRKPAKSNLAFDTLVQTRGFLQELYEG